MAIPAFWTRFDFIPVGDVAAIGMQISGSVTLGAFHLPFGKMNIRFVIRFGAGKFAEYPAAVATGAHCLHGWLFKLMTSQKTAFSLKVEKYY